MAIYFSWVGSKTGEVAVDVFLLCTCKYTRTPSTVNSKRMPLVSIPPWTEYIEQQWCSFVIKAYDVLLVRFEWIVTFFIQTLHTAFKDFNVIISIGQGDYSFRYLPNMIPDSL